MTCLEAQSFLDAYLDGELDLTRSLELEGHVQGCESCAHGLQDLQDLSAAVAAVARFPPSPALRRRLAGIVDQRSPTAGARWLILAAGLALAGFLVGRYLPTRANAVSRITQEVVQDHVRSLQANHLLDVAVGQQILPWFFGKLDYTPVLESSSWRGFELAGARLDYLSGRPVAALVYRQGPHIVNIFVRPIPGEGERPPQSRVSDGFQVVSWRAYGMDWWAVSDLSESELEELAMCPCFMPPNRTLRADGAKPKSD